MKPLIEFSRDTSTTDALRRLWVADAFGPGSKRTVASEWCWEGQNGSAVISLHGDTPEPWPGAQGRLRDGDLRLPLDGHDLTGRKAIQVRRHNDLMAMLARLADANAHVVVLVMNWQRDTGTGRFTEEQRMYPVSAWQVRVEWADREQRIVRLYDPPLTEVRDSPDLAEHRKAVAQEDAREWGALDSKDSGR